MIDSLVAVGILLGSYHHCQDCNYQEQNPGLIMEGENVMASVYRNSYNRLSVGVYGTVAPVQIGGVAVGAFAGLQTGYKYIVGGGLFARADHLMLALVPGTGENKWTLAIALRVPL